MNKTIETITAEQADKMLELMLGNSFSPNKRMRGVRNRCMMLLMLDAGLRVGEVVGMKQTDLYVNDSPRNAIRVSKKLGHGIHDRIVPLSERLQIAIDEMQRHCWSKDQIPWPLMAFYCHRSLTRLSTRQVERIISKYSLLAFGEAIHPHILRHTFATRLMRNTSLRIVQELLGHVNISSTQRYTHPNDQDLKTAIKKMDEVLPCRHPLHQGLPSCPDRER